MRIALASDHRGTAARAALRAWLERSGYQVDDLGTNATGRVDYPDYAFQVAQRVQSGQAERGILICGTGIGMAIAANKVPGIRAAPVYDTELAEMARRHNDINVLCLPADRLDDDQRARLAERFLETPFDGGRHARRLEKIAASEEANCAESGQVRKTLPS